MYRLAVLALDRNIPLYDTRPRRYGLICKNRVCDKNGVFRVLVDGFEVTHKLRTPKTDEAVKHVSMAESVRRVLVDHQRAIARKGVWSLKEGYY